MRRLIFITVLGVIALPLIAQAQMRGMVGRSSGSSRGSGFSPRARVSPAFSSRRPVGARTFVSSGRIAVSRGSFPVRRFHQRPFVSFRGCFGFPCRNRFFFGNSFIFGASLAPYPYYPYYPAYYPYGPEQPIVAGGDTSNETRLAVEVQRLSDEVENLRDEQGRQTNMPQQPASSPSASLSAQSPSTSTTFVFRDGRRISVQNYAIAGQTLWILNEHAARRIALADLDWSATEQLNAANGINLRLSEPAPAH